MTKREFFHILRKYREGTATEEESRFIESYYELFEGEPGMGAWFKPQEDEHVKKDMLNAIWEKIYAQESSKQNHGRIRDFRLPVKVAAAVLILVAGGLLYFFAGNKHKGPADLANQETEIRYKNDIQPGGNKAVLTLSNGQTIILDHANTGMLAQQGDTRVIKLDSGKLSYQGAIAAKNRARKVLYNTITTPRGGQYEVILPDGSRVWLNAASSLRFPTEFQGTSRNVEVSGEAYFEVAKGRRPFIVKAGEAKVEVLGTHFDIQAYNGEGSIKTTLAEGSVRVSRGVNTCLLKPGQQAGMNLQTGHLHVRQVNVNEVLAWKNGLFYFDNTSIENIMQEISRWYDVDVVYATNRLDEKIFSGVISRYSTVAPLLKRLELTGTVHFRVDGRKITVTD